MASPLNIGVTTLLKYVNLGCIQNINGLLTNGGYIRLQPNERDIENPQGTFTWNNAGPKNLDAAMSILSGFPKLKVIMVMQNFASWYLDGNGLPTYQGMQAYGNAIMQHYGNAVSILEMGNEEFSFVSGAARNPSNYYTVISNTYPYLKNLYPSLPLGMYGYTNYSGKSSGNGDPGTWFGGLFGLGGGKYMDYAQIHYYHNSFSPDENNPGGSPPFLNVINAINTAEQANGLTIPISVGEFGYQAQPASYNGGCSNLVSTDVQTQYEELLMSEALAAQNVWLTCIYTSGAFENSSQDCHDIGNLATYNNLIPFIANINATPPPPPPPGVPPSQTGYGGFISQGSPIGASTGGYVFHNERVRQMFVGPGARGRNGRHVKTWKDLLPWN